MEINRKYRTTQDVQKSPIGIQKRVLTDPNRLLFEIYYHLGNYGESIQHPISWMIITILIFTSARFFSAQPNVESLMLYFYDFGKTFF